MTSDIIDIYFPKNATKKYHKKNKINPADYSKYVGKYRLPSRKIITISKDEDRLFAQSQGNTKFELQAEEDIKFMLEYTDAEVEFKKGAFAKHYDLIINQNGNKIIATNLENHPKISKAKMATFVGTYYSNELESFYKVYMKGNKLMLKTKKYGELKLYHEEDKLFNVQYSLAKVNFIRNRYRRIIGMRVSTGRVKGIWFSKLKRKILEELRKPAIL